MRKVVVAMIALIAANYPLVVVAAFGGISAVLVLFRLTRSWACEAGNVKRPATAAICCEPGHVTRE
jgi:hypothetical protein